jgi:hypothetical protein
MRYDVTVWEQIRNSVELSTRTLVQNIGVEISKDHSLLQYRGTYPVSWQLREIMQQRAESWVQRFYDPCCDAYKQSGKELSIQFDTAMWAYWIEPLLMREVENCYGYRGSMLLELLLCAVGSSPENRRLLKVGQKDCCLSVRLAIYETWYDKLHHLPPRINQAFASISRFRATKSRAASIVPGLPPEPVVVLATPPKAEKEPSKIVDSDAPSLTPAQSIADPLSAARWQNILRNPASLTAAPSATAEGGWEQPPKPVAIPTTGSGIEKEPSKSVKSVARSVADPPSPTSQLPEIIRNAESLASPSSIPEGTWEQIAISFLSDERVQIHIGKKYETLNYAEFGFGNHRTNNPTKAWQILRKLAQLRGVIKDGSEASVHWPKVEKRVQEIRRVLRKHFAISSDPLPFVENLGYKARFKIGCGPSFRT